MTSHQDPVQGTISGAGDGDVDHCKSPPCCACLSLFWGQMRKTLLKVCPEMRHAGPTGGMLWRCGRTSLEESHGGELNGFVRCSPWQLIFVILGGVVAGSKKDVSGFWWERDEFRPSM